MLTNLRTIIIFYDILRFPMIFLWPSQRVPGKEFTDLGEIPKSDNRKKRNLAHVRDPKGSQKGLKRGLGASQMTRPRNQRGEMEKHSLCDLFAFFMLFYEDIFK